jgi:hypothetical protein
MAKDPLSKMKKALGGKDEDETTDEPAEEEEDEDAPEEDEEEQEPQPKPRGRPPKAASYEPEEQEAIVQQQRKPKEDPTVELLRSVGQQPLVPIAGWYVIPIAKSEESIWIGIQNDGNRFPKLQPSRKALVQQFQLSAQLLGIDISDIDIPE